jgi:hypothetical protein
MPELEGQLSILDAIRDELDGEPSPARALKVLDEAGELGWEVGACSFVIRLNRDDALPWFARWDLSVSDAGKKSWKFAGARAQNGQPLAYRDLKVYLSDPDVIHPEPPDSDCEAAEFDNPDQTIRGALGAVAPISKPDPAYVNGPPRLTGPDLFDWGALLNG